jgi:hypothetical protein
VADADRLVAGHVDHLPQEWMVADMVCEQCRSASTETIMTRDDRVKLHSQCPGLLRDYSWCDCQHRVPSEIVIPVEERSANAEGSRDPHQDR